MDGFGWEGAAGVIYIVASGLHCVQDLTQLLITPFRSRAEVTLQSPPTSLDKGGVRGVSSMEFRLENICLLINLFVSCCFTFLYRAS